MNVTQQEINKYLSYSATTGVFTWLKRGRENFPTTRSFSTWNKRFAGKEAGTLRTGKTGKTYRYIMFNKSVYRAHRLAWLLSNGSFPVDQIDHINGNGTDNRLVNLREVTNAENHKNQKLAKNNTSGVAGVFWHKRDKRWESMIYVKGKARRLGRFINKDEAIKARKKAEKEEGFHVNHGTLRPL